MTDPANVNPWRDDFAAALGDDFEVELWAADQPFAPQVKGALAVVDVGALLQAGMVPQAAEAGVKLWQLIFTGYDQIDLDRFRASGIPVANTPGQFSARGLAELALMLMLCAIRRFTQSQRDLHAGRFSHTFGEELAGRTLGLIGLGASGRELAKLAIPLGLHVVGVTPPGPSAEMAAGIGVEVVGGPERLDELLGRSDVVSIHVPLTPATRRMIGSDALSKMKATSILINVARGQIVDQVALVEALRSQRIAGAGLDVFAVEPLPLDDPLLSLANVVLTPHVAGATRETSERRGVAAADNVRRVARGETPLYVVS